MLKWLKAIGKDMNMVLIKEREEGVLKIVENAMRFGNIVLIENVALPLNAYFEYFAASIAMRKGVP